MMTSRTDLRGAAAEGRDLGREHAEAVLRALRDAGPATAPALAAAVGIADRNVRTHLARLADAGFVERRGTRWSLTPAGAAQAGPSAGRTDVADVLALLPSEAHQALVRLVLSAVVARKARAGDGVTGWPAFGLWGPPGTGKTTLPRLLARFFGLPEYEIVRVASDLDRAELLGRRVPDGKGGYRFAPAAALGRPLLCLDELDKVRGDRRLDALRLLQGDSALTLEGDRVVVAATVLVTLNAGRDPRDVLPPDRLRRMVHVSTVGISEAACRTAARRLFDEGAVPVLDLARLDVGASPSADVLRFFDNELPRSLVPAARPLHPGHALALIVPGRTSLDGTDEETAMLGVARDYLTCAATWGGTTPALEARFSRRTGDDAPEPGDDEGAAHGAAARERSGRVEAVRLAQSKALVKGRLHDYAKALGSAQDDEARMLRAGLAEAVRQVKAARTVDDVREIVELAEALRADVDARLARIEARHWATGERPRRAGTRGVVPDRLAVLEALVAYGHRTAPGPVLESLGLVVSEPLPTGRGRWHGNAPGETWGAVVFEDSGWTDLAVASILAHALAVERGLRPAERTALLA